MEPKPEQRAKTELPAPTVPSKEDVERTERVVLQLLLDRPRTSIEIKMLVKKSREHSARLMKELFERQLVSRDEREKPFVHELTEKPFVHELTEEGRRYLSAG